MCKRRYHLLADISNWSSHLLFEKYSFWMDYIQDASDSSQSYKNESHTNCFRLMVLYLNN